MILFPIFIAVAIIITGYDVTHCSNCHQNKVGVDNVTTSNDITNTTDKIANDSDGTIDAIDESFTNDATNTMVLMLLLPTYLFIVNAYAILRLFQMISSMP